MRRATGPMVIWLQTATNAVKMAHIVSVLAEKREAVRGWVWVDMGGYLRGNEFYDKVRIAQRCLIVNQNIYLVDN